MQSVKDGVYTHQRTEYKANRSALDVSLLSELFTGTTHVDNELYLSKALEKLGSHAMSREGEPDIGAAFIKFSIVAREVSSLMKTLMQSLHNIIMFPVENLLKGDLRGVKGSSIASLNVSVLNAMRCLL